MLNVFAETVAFRTPFLWLPLLLLNLVVIVGCGSGTSGNKGSKTLTAIALTPTGVILNTGATQQFMVTGAYSDGSQTDVTSSAAWATSNGAVATVNASGMLNAIASGTVTATASVGTTSAAASITVNPQLKSLTSISITPDQLSIPIGGTQQLAATGHYSDNTQADLTTTATWQSSNGKVASVSSTGALFAVAAGQANIIATDTSIGATLGVVVNGIGATPVDVLTWRNDLARTGQNLNETVLTPTNVNVSTFGKKFSFAVDGYVYGQPLVVTNQNISDGTHNVVYVVTANDSVYAFDADGATTTPYWQDSLTNAANGLLAVAGANLGVGDFWGIIATPVIDRSRNTIYVVSRVVNTNGDPANASSYHQYIHALDLSTGAEKTGQPVEISVCVPGSGADTSGGQVCFNPWKENNRVSLALVNDVVYAGWASLNDVDPYHGWVLGYDADTLKLVATFNSTPNGKEGGFWMAGAAPACDSSGNLYLVSGNGDFSASADNYGQSAVRLGYANGAFALTDYFTPFNWAMMDIPDLDVGSGGALLLPDNNSSHPHQITFSGKEGNIFLVDRDSMGQFQSLNDSQIVQEIAGAFPKGIFSTPAYWNGNLYYVGNGDVITQFTWTNGLISSTPVAVGTSPYSFPGASPAVSANGTSSAIVWTMERTSTGNHITLHAYDATNVANELYNSTQNAARDDAGLAVKFTVPTIANGKVYIGTIYKLEVYGLF
jgi:hypothetical protein